MTATLTDTILTVDDIRSPILQAGPPHATEAVVAVQGNPGSSQDWVRLVERTGAFGRAVAWDHPGSSFRATELSVIAGISENSSSASRQPRSGSVSTGGIPLARQVPWPVRVNAMFDERIPAGRLNA